MKSIPLHRVLIVMLATALAWSSIQGPRFPLEKAIDMGTTVSAGLATANGDTHFVMTSSQDGKTIFLWRFESGHPPKYIGRSEAIIQQ